MHAIKSLKNKTITILLTILIAVSLLFGAAVAVLPSARADIDDDTVEFDPVDLSLSNTSFSQSSGDYPATPTSWTGEYVGDGKGAIVKGVVDLTPSVYSTGGNKKYKLDQYPEYTSETDIPKTIFGEKSEYGDNEKALLINTEEGASVAYTYKSDEITLNRNSFYRFSVWVKTGNFHGQGGATVKLSGLGQNFSFNNIDTVRNNYNDKNELTLDKSNNYGWVEYKMYVRTSASLSKTVRLCLGLGDAVTGNDEDAGVNAAYASGYVFFDKVEAKRISAYDFAAETLSFEKTSDRDNVYRRNTSLAIDLNEAKSLTDNEGNEIGTFSQNTNKWKPNVPYDAYDESASTAANAHSAIYNSQNRISNVDSSTNVHGLTKNPWAPYGQAEYNTMDGISPFLAGDLKANIMLISTYDGREFLYGSGGVASPYVTVERFKYYRFSVWVKGDSVDGGDGISVLLKGKLKSASNANLLKSYTGLDGDSEDRAHYGWKEQVIYIHGSMLYDYDISFELWLGSPDSTSSGVAMFDNVTFTELKYSDYSAMSEADSGEFYAIDDLDDNSNISNGSFINVGDMDEIKYPLPVAEWTYLTPDTVSATGFVSNKVDTDNAVYGIVPTDTDTFESIVASRAIPYSNKPNTTTGNVLMLASTTKTAFCYQSPSITISTDTAYKITVEMQVGRVDGYGASLVLKTTDGAVISTIENIKDTNEQFRTYTFYVAAPLSEQTVYVEIWLGLNDRKDNTQNLSSGYVYVKQASLNEWTAAEGSTVEAEYNDLLKQYKYETSHSSTMSELNYGLYSFTAPSFDYYDVYSYAQRKGNGFGIPYKWNTSFADPKSVISGVFNTEDRQNLDIYPGFSTNGLSGNMLYIYNAKPNYTKYTYDNSIALVANKYYRIDIKVKVHVIDEVRTDEDSVGAGLSLTGSTAAFTNIKDTTNLIDVNNEASRDYETFQTYSFYISTGDEGGNIGLDITFGGETQKSHIQGCLIIGGIEMAEIDNLDYEAAQALSDNKVIAVELSKTADETNDSNTEASSGEIQWWIIPTIIFSVALIAVIILILVVRIRDHIKSKRKVTYSTEYDRSDVMDDLDKLRAQTEEAERQKQKEQKSEAKEAPHYEETPVETPEQDGNNADEAETPAEEPTPAPAEEPKKPDDDLDD